MSDYNYIQTSFNGGELSPRILGRLDLDKYKSGLQTCRNAIILPHGGVVRRPGFQYIASTKNSNKKCRVIPFIFNEEQAYILEIGEGYMRVYRDGGQVATVDSYTKLIVHFNGKEATTVFTDKGNTGHTITVAGNAQCTELNKKFGIGSGLFDGTGDYATVLDHADWFMSTGKFTIDFWVRFNSVATDQRFFAQWVDTSNQWNLKWDQAASQLIFRVKSAAATIVEMIGSWTPVINTWYHIAVIRGWGGNANDWAITVSGDTVATVTDVSAIPDLAAVFSFGGESVSGMYLNGWLDEFRVSKGIARWEASFNPPQKQYPYDGTIGGGTVYENTDIPYVEGDLMTLQYVQTGDILYIVHKDYNVYKITRNDHDDWTVAEIDWDEPPWMDQNTTATTLDPAAVTGTSIAIVASAAYWTSSHVGAYYKMHDGFLRITGVTDTTNATCDIKSDLTAHTATADWSKGVWDDIDGFPQAIAIYEDRLCLASSATYPLTVFLSKTDDYEDFGVSSPVVDSDALSKKIAAQRQNRIQWLLGKKKLFIGTGGNELWMTGETIDSPITPTSTLVRSETPHGSELIQPVEIGHEILFIVKGAKSIFSQSYDYNSESYSSVDISILSEHLTKTYGFVQIAYQDDPWRTLWGIRTDGRLIGCTFLREHQVVAWHRHDTGTLNVDGIESIAVIPGTDEGELWMSVKRFINGAWSRNIERMASQFWSNDIEDAFFVDSGLTYDGALATDFSGMDHLEGEDIDVLADAAVITDKSISSGAFTLASAANVVHAGLNYVTDIETLPLDIPTKIGTIRNKRKDIIKFMLQLYESLYFQHGPDSSNLIDGIGFTAATLFSGDLMIETQINPETNVSLFLRQGKPLPFTLLNIVSEIEIGEDT